MGWCFCPSQCKNFSWSILPCGVKITPTWPRCVHMLASLGLNWDSLNINIVARRQYARTSQGIDPGTMNHEYKPKIHFGLPRGALSQTLVLTLPIYHLPLLWCMSFESRFRPTWHWRHGSTTLTILSSCPWSRAWSESTQSVQFDEGGCRSEGRISQRALVHGGDIAVLGCWTFL